MSIRGEKSALQYKVNIGAISNPRALQLYLWNRGWQARLTERVSKTNRKILIIMPGVNRNFQLEVDWPVSGADFDGPGIWIYALMAKTGSEMACYVGQSKSIMRRMAEHAKRSRPGRSSDSLFKWADERGTDVRAVILELSESRGEKGKTTHKATSLEGAWLMAAVTAGYATPDIERWGQLPVPHENTVRWDDEKIGMITVSLDEVIENSPWLREFCLNPPAFLYKE